MAYETYEKIEGVIQSVNRGGFLLFHDAFPDQ